MLDTGVKHEMGIMQVSIWADNDERLRKLNRRKGDISNHINKALRKYLDELDNTPVGVQT